MRLQWNSTLVAAAMALASPVWATTYNFDVMYSGMGVAALAVGSDDPMAQALVPGDSFDWTITAQGGADAWRVQTGGSFFPLMAFGVDEPGIRTGDFTLNLLSGGAVVFTTTQTDVQVAQVHLGTNEITLDTGVVFDQMKLHYSLTTAHEDPTVDGVDPDNLLPITSTPNSLLPIFGAPEMSKYAPGIIYSPAPVPEPATWALLLCGGALVSALRRRRS